MAAVKIEYDALMRTLKAKYVLAHGNIKLS